MQLFRVKDCKQIGKKKADGISPSAWLLSFIYIFIPIFVVNLMRWVVLLSLLASLAVLVSAVVLRDHTRLIQWCPPFTHPFSVSL